MYPLLISPPFQICVAAPVKSSVRCKKIHSHAVLSPKSINSVKRHYYIFEFAIASNLSF